MNGRPRRIGVLLFDKVKTLDFVGPAEVFVEANQRVENGYDLIFLSPDGQDIRTSMGLRVAVDAAASDAGELDTLIIPGSESAPGVYDHPGVREAITHLVPHAVRVASICSGAFALAQAGLLDGRGATTHWKFTSALAERYPNIDVQPDSIFVRDGNIYSSAGVAAGIDLALALVEEDHGADIARSVAQLLLVYMRRAGGQSQFSASMRVKAPRTSVARAISDYINEDPTRPATVRDLAAHANVSARHLNRVVRDELGMTPTQYVNSMRLDLAVTLLEAGLSVSEVAASTGYAAPVAFRRAFVARFSATPSAYQRRFQTTAARSVAAPRPVAADRPGELAARTG